MEKLRNKAREMTTDMILEALEIIGGGHVNPDVRMARAAIVETWTDSRGIVFSHEIDVYAERYGEESADKLMDSIGLGL